MKDTLLEGPKVLAIDAINHATFYIIHRYNNYYDIRTSVILSKTTPSGMFSLHLMG